MNSLTRTHSRRDILALGATTVGSALLAGCVSEDNDSYDAPNPLFGPGGSRTVGGAVAAAGGVGSGFAYEEPAVTQDQATHAVTTADQLVEAVQAGTPDQPAVVWIPPDAAIDMTGRDAHLENVIISSSRSVNHAGGIIYTESIGASSTAYSRGSVTGVFEMGDNARFTGVRLRGPTSNVSEFSAFPGYLPYPDGGRSKREQYYNAHRARAITITGQNAQVDNCEVFGWAQHGIMVDGARSYQRDQAQIQPLVSNCSIHDNAMTSSGYGVVTAGGHVFVRDCFLNACRHSIAGEGFPDAGYTLQRCFFGPVQSLFPVDQHYLGENSHSGSDPNGYHYRYRSGGLMRVLSCTFTASHVFSGANFNGGNPTPAIVIAAIPDKKVVVKGNQFVHGPPGSSGPSVFSQSHNPGRLPEGPHGFVRWEIGENEFNIDVPYEIGQG